MTILDVIAELERIKKDYGDDIIVQIQDEPKNADELITNYQSFFILPEEYEDGWFCNIRWWPY